MHTTITARQGEELVIRVETTPSETDRAFKDGLDSFVVQYNLFDAEGETAREKIISVFGEENAQDAIFSAAVNFLVPFALHEQNILPLSTYNIEAESELKEGEPFVFSMTVLPRPQYELTSYEPVEVTIPAVGSVSESDIDQQIEMLAHQFAHMSQPNASEEELIVPEITDGWVQEHFQSSEIISVAALREQMRQASEQELAARSEQMKMDAIMQAWFPRFSDEISEKMLDAMTEELFETFQSQLAQEGVVFEDFLAQQNMSEDDIRSSLAAQAKDQLIQGFILDAIYRHENLSIDLSDLKAAVHGIAPGREEETLEALEKSGRAFLLRESASRLKAAAWLLNSSHIEEV